MSKYQKIGASRRTLLLKGEAMEELFYVLDTIYASNIRFFAGGQIISESEARCPVCHSLISSSGTKTIKVALNHLGKQGFAEYLWNSHSLPLFRADLINLWQGAGLSGFRTEPVEIIGWFGSGNQPSLESIPNYYSLITTSYVQLVEPLPEDECKQCGFIRYSFTRIGNHLPNGLRINLRTWDGADFFGLIGYPFLLF